MNIDSNIILEQSFNRAHVNRAHRTEGQLLNSRSFKGAGLATPAKPALMPIRPGDIQIAFASQLDGRILDDYFQKRERWFKERLNLPAYSHGRDEFDDESHIVLATDGEESLGGLRATIRRPGDGETLPMESHFGGFKVAELFPDSGLSDAPYAEISKLVVKSNRYQLGFNNDIVQRLLRFLLVTDNPEPGVRLVFIVAPKVQMRIYTFEACRLGVKFETRALPDEFVGESERRFVPFSVLACFLK